MKSVLHFSGPLRTYQKGGRVKHSLSGWAVCCTGDRCRAITCDRMTDNRLLVSCKGCLREIKREIEGRIIQAQERP